MMRGYVICRTNELSASGCDYWTGSVACLPSEGEGAGALAYVGAAASRHNVLVLETEQEAFDLALWLNTCPAPRRIDDVGLWRVLSLPGAPKERSLPEGGLSLRLSPQTSSHQGQR